jgi:hypothetical protein
MNDQTIINGGEELQIFLTDGSKETVRVKLLKVKKFEDYLRAIENEEATAELLCGKDPGWAENVTASSLLDIVEKGHDINFTTVCRWAERRANVNEAMLPLALRGQKLAAASPTSAPTPPS